MSDVLTLGLGESLKHAPHLKVERRPYKGGNEGVADSVGVVNAKIREGMHDLRVLDCAGRMLETEGDPRDRLAQARAILRQLRKRTVYVADQPKTERIAAAVQTLCLDDKGFCLRAGDCDDLLVAYASLVMSIGFHWRTIIARYDGSPIFTHIYGAIRNDTSGNWLRVDPAALLPLGEAYPADEERYFDPLKDGVPTGLGKESALTKEALVGLGRMPPLEHGTARARVQRATLRLGRSLARYQSSLHRAQALELEAPEDRGCFPGALSLVGRPRWDVETQALAQDLRETAREVYRYGDEASRGLRGAAHGPAGAEIAAAPADTFHLQPLGQAVAVRDPKSGDLWGGFELATGKVLSPSAAVDFVGGVFPPLAGVAATAALILAIAELCDLGSTTLDAIGRARAVVSPASTGVGEVVDGTPSAPSRASEPGGLYVFLLGVATGGLGFALAHDLGAKLGGAPRHERILL